MGCTRREVGVRVDAYRLVRTVATQVAILKSSLQADQPNTQLWTWGLSAS